MSGSSGEALAGPLRRLVAEVWALRREVELEAALRFARLADRLGELGEPESMVALARRAAEDERRHASLCEELAREYGQTVWRQAPTAVTEVAPARLPLRERVLYELVAACCITETESTAVLTTLRGADGPPRVREVLQALLRDEVMHSRLGWAQLARAHEGGQGGFLSRYLPAMLEGGTSPRLFAPGTPEEEDPELPRHGVLPHTRKREVFVQALRQVILPGLERFGVETVSARQWLEQRGA